MEPTPIPPTRPTEQQPQLPPPSPSPSPSPPQPSSSSSLPPSSSSLAASTPSSPALPSSSNPNPSPRLPFNRPWPQPSPFPSHFSSHLHSSSPSTPPVPPFSSSAPPSSSLSAPPAQKGGMAIGVPAHHPSPTPPQPASFSSLNPPSFGQQFGGLARNSGNVPDSGTSPGTSQVRQPIQGIQGMGTMGSFGSGPPMRPSGVAGHHQQRPVQSSARPQTTQVNQSPNSPNFQGQGTRVPSVGSPGLSSPSTSQSLQVHNQPWLSSGSQGKPPLPSPPVRSITSMLSLQQRSHIPQQHNRSTSTASQQPQTSSSQQPPSTSHLPQEHHGQQFPTSRDPQSLPHQQNITKGAGVGNQKGSLHTVVQPTPVQSVPLNRTVTAESGESCNRILSKRSIQELVTQIDPSERLDPDVEDILVDIAEDFVDSITTFGCSLAKHRKSNTLEAKDILLHLERNWNMTLPGFSGDEIKIYRKPFSNEIHRERLASIKRSVASADIANTRSSAGQAVGNAKSHIPKAQLNVIGSPNPKIREAA